MQAWPSAINPHPSRIANAILERDAFDFIDDESRGTRKSQAVSPSQVGSSCNAGASTTRSKQSQSENQRTGSTSRPRKRPAASTFDRKSRKSVAQKPSLLIATHSRIDRESLASHKKIFEIAPISLCKQKRSIIYENPQICAH